MDEYRAFRTWQDRLRAALAQWEASGKDVGALLRGTPLAEAEGWLAERGEFLGQGERPYIEASIEERKRETAEREAQRQRELALEKQRTRAVRMALGITLLLLALAIGAAVFGFIQQNIAETNLVVANRQQRLSLAQSLAALSQVVYQGSFDSQLSTLLAIEAYRINREDAGDISGFVDSALRPVLDQESPYFNATMHGHELAVWSVAFSPNGQILASGGEDGTIRLWNLSAPEGEPLILRGHMSTVWSVAFSSNGRTLASGGDDGTIRLWDISTLEAEPFVLHGHVSRVRSVVFSPGGQTLASGSEDGTIRLWDLSALEVEPLILRGHEGWVSSVAFNTGGQTLASGSEDGTIRLWDLSALEVEPLILRGHEGWVLSVAFSPDGQTLASGGVDQTIRLWGLSAPEAESRVLHGHEGWVLSVPFSPDGQTLASGSRGPIRLWVLLDELVEIGCRQVRRNLTWEEWQRYLRDEPYRQTCPNLLPHSSVPAEELGE